MSEKKERKLKFELVPESCWYSNLRSLLPKEGWDYIKKEVKAKAEGVCQICGKKTGRLEAHEVWSYNEKASTQKLENVVAICADCHACIHIGRTSLVGNMQKAEDHYMKVNGLSYAEFRQDLGEANDLHKRLNSIPEWKLDISKLKEIIE